MKKSYLTLTNGRKVRIEANWNSQVNFHAATGIDMDEFVALASKEQLKPEHLRSMAYACALEGERMDGKDLGLSEIEFAGYMSMSSVYQFVAIFKEQFAPGESKKKEPGSPPLFLTRIKNLRSRST